MTSLRLYPAYIIIVIALFRIFISATKTSTFFHFVFVSFLYLYLYLFRLFIRITQTYTIFHLIFVFIFVQNFHQHNKDIHIVPPGMKTLNVYSMSGRTRLHFFYKLSSITINNLIMLNIISSKFIS